MPDIIERCRKAVKSRQHFVAREGENETVVDMQTANAIVQVYDALLPENQMKFSSLPIEKMGTVAWKCIRAKAT